MTVGGCDGLICEIDGSGAIRHTIDGGAASTNDGITGIAASGAAAYDQRLRQRQQHRLSPRLHTPPMAALIVGIGISPGRAQNNRQRRGPWCGPYGLQRS